MPYTRISSLLRFGVRAASGAGGNSGPGRGAPWTRYGLSRNGYGLVTLHRPSNVDAIDRLRDLIGGFALVAESLPLLWPVHPRARAQLAGIALPAGLQLAEPTGYRDMAQLLDGCAVVLTDSGGLQEESTALGVPCVTLREATERPITVTEGTNRLVPWPPTAAGIAATVAAARSGSRGARARIAGWDGHAAERVVRALEDAPPSAGRCG